MKLTKFKYTCMNVFIDNRINNYAIYNEIILYYYNKIIRAYMYMRDYYLLCTVVSCQLPSHSANFDRNYSPSMEIFCVILAELVNLVILHVHMRLPQNCLGLREKRCSGRVDFVL